MGDIDASRLPQRDHGEGSSAPLAGPPQPPAGSRAGSRRDIAVLWCVNAVDGLGSQASGLVFPLLLLDLGHGPGTAGVFATSAALAGVLLGPLVAVPADRGHRRHLMTGAAVLAAVAMAGLAVSCLRHPPLGILLGLAFTERLCATVYETAARGALRLLAAPDELPRAVAGVQAGDQTALVLGPALGGVLFTVSRVLPFAVDAVSYAAAALGVRAMRTPLDSPPVHANPTRIAATSTRIAAAATKRRASDAKKRTSDAMKPTAAPKKRTAGPSAVASEPSTVASGPRTVSGGPAAVVNDPSTRTVESSPVVAEPSTPAVEPNPLAAEPGTLAVEASTPEDEASTPEVEASTPADEAAAPAGGPETRMPPVPETSAAAAPSTSVPSPDPSSRPLGSGPRTPLQDAADFSGVLRAGLVAVVRSPVLRLVLLWSSVASGVLALLFYTAVFVLGTTAGGTATGTVLAASGAAGLVGSLVAARVVRRFGARRSLTAATWLLLVPCAALSAADGPWLWGLCFCALCLVLPVVTVVLGGAAVLAVPEDLQSRTGAVLGSATAVTAAVAPALAAALVTWGGARAPALVCAAVLVLLAVHTQRTAGDVLRPAPAGEGHEHVRPAGASLGSRT
ncbi:MFS transporter [Streptomyces sp. NPDC020800]|uniref:MFS transporter n=1 Tax=Streptomyces sp. NPDC020800 TaxID=3365092 RepID=UPI0037A48230